MDSSLYLEFLKWIMAGAALVIPVVAFSSLQRRRDRERYDMDLRLKREELKFTEYNLHQSTRNLDRDERYGAKYIDELMHRFGRLEKRIASQRAVKMDPEVDGKIDYIIKELSRNNKVQIEEKSDNDTSEQMIKEISHALNTPLSQIEVAASIALTPDNQDSLVESAQSIINSVQICKAFLGAYRELILTSSASVWNPASLSKAIESSCNVYISKMNKKVVIDVDLPDDIDGYSNNYITALMLPIIENAIEASNENATVVIGHAINEESININIKNETNEKITSEDIFISGFTTKKEHEGLGLSSVKSLLSAIRGADINYQVKGLAVTFNLLLPRKV